MADALISLLIETLGSMAFEKIKEEIGLLRGVEEEVENLKTTLHDIQAVLEEAEESQLTKPSVRNWLDKLKDASLDIDDVLDEWLTPTALNSMMEEAQGGEEKVVSVMKKVWLSLLSRCICSGGGTTDQVVVRHRIANEIKELNENLDRIAKAEDRYKLKRVDHVDRSLRASSPLRKITKTSVSEEKVWGREVEKEILVKKLLHGSGSSDHEGGGFGRVAIVGIGGLGKTTLAQLAYNDGQVNKRFDNHIWVCVSDPFDEIKVAKAILRGLNGSFQDSDELNDLLHRIHGLVKGNKFLLVLDDVWNESYDRWEELEKSLGNGVAGSRILVTTRNENVATTMGVAKYDMMKLATMSNEHCWQIFSNRAFFDRTEEECRRLEETGRKISEKSKGLPLIAKTLGGLMRSKKTINEWNGVLNNKLWELKDDQNIFAPFFLSYYDLLPSEKRCLLYCSVFPKDYKIEKGMLVRMWMSQGCLGCNVNLEEEGEACFESLARRSFFQDFKKSELDGSIESCKMHDIVCDFVKFLTKDEYRIVEELVGACVDKNHNALDERTRHLTIDVLTIKETLGALKYNEKDRTKLRTLFIKSVFPSEDEDSLFLHQTRIRTLIFSSGIAVLKDIGKLIHLRYLQISCRLANCNELPDMICDLYNLQTLNLRGSHCANLPENIGKLVNLRYLDLSLCGMTALPDSICNLSKLKTLRLEFCRELERLPASLGKLIGLRHLHLLECDKLVALPKGMASLTGLQTLSMFPLTKDTESNMSVGDLKALRHVLKSQLSFHLYGCTNIRSASEAREIGVADMESLADLTLKFGNNRQPIEEKGIEDHHKGILEAIQPTPSLKLLAIDDYMGPTMSPKWMMSLTNLSCLDLYKGLRCRTLPPLGKLPSLERLSIWDFEMLEEVGPQFLGLENVDEDGDFVSFPKLKHLYFDGAKRWESWMGGESATSPVVMPSLNYLRLENCDRLGGLPDFLPWHTITELVIKDCKVLKTQYQRQSGTKWSKISHINSVSVD